MILAPYILRNYAIYFLCINSGLVLLYSVIEFFEKISRVHHATLDAVTQFILLNSIPNFFSLFPLSAWLACCFLLRETSQRNEFTTISTLGITHKTFILSLMWAGTILFIAGFIGNETIAYHFAKKSSTLNQSVFKKKTLNLISDRWLRLNNTTYTHIDKLNREKNTGTNIRILYFNQSGALIKQITGAHFSIEPDNNRIIIDTPHVKNFFEPQPTVAHKISLLCPSFFTQLVQQSENRSLPTLISHISHQQNIFCASMLRAEIGLLLERIVEPLKSLIFCFLSITLFIFFINTTYIKWISILLCYPIFICITTISSYLVQNGASPLFHLIPYLGALSLGSAIYALLCKQ